MAINETFPQLPSTGAATMSDIICAVQGYNNILGSGLSVQETLGQVYTLFQSNLILSYAGNPNGNVAGTAYQFCWDTTDNVLYICNHSGNASTAVWVNSNLTGAIVANPGSNQTIFGDYTFTLQGPLVAPSINFGQSTLNIYEENVAWTPALTFATAGDLSVSYGIQDGLYTRIGNIVTLFFTLNATPTFTTSSGALQITGLPYAVNPGISGYGNCLFQASDFPASTSSISLQATINTSLLHLLSSGSGTSFVPFTTTQCTSGNTLNIYGSLSYPV